jgi:hypothetical protein
MVTACAADTNTPLDLSASGLIETNVSTLGGTLGVPYAGGLGVTFSVPNSNPGTLYYWTVTGTIPPGLFVTPTTNTTTSSALMLIGTPVQAGEFSIQIMVHTSNHTLLIPAVPFTVSITGDTGTPPSVPPSSLTWVVDAPSKQTLTATGGKTPYTNWTSGTALPSWLTLNPVTGELAGTPTTTGTFPLSIIVADSAGRFGTGQVTLTVISLAQFAGTWTGMIAGGPEDGKRLSLLANDRGVVQQGTKGADVIATPSAPIQLAANTQGSVPLTLDGWIQLTGILNWHLVCSQTASVDSLDCIGHDLDTPANDGTLTLTRINSASQDNVAPTVTSSSPVNGATGVTNPLVSVEFSEMMSSPGTGAITLSGGPGTLSAPYYLANTSDLSGRTLKIQLNGLQSGTTYTLTLNPAGNATLRDLPGNPLATKTIVFTMGTVSTNRPPTATAATYFVAPNTPLSITLTGTDPEAQSLTFSVVTQPTSGSLTGSAPNLSYQSATTGVVDTFTFTASDPAGNISAPATVTITGLRPPIAASQQLPVLHDTSLPITLNGTSQDAGATITGYTIVPGSGPTNGSLSGIGAARTYIPSTGFIGMDGFQFTVTDSRGLVSPPGTVTITVTATEPPVATSQAITIVRRQGTDSLSASRWAIPLTGSPGNVVFRIVRWPAHGALTNFVQGATYKTSFNPSTRIISTVTATTSATLNGTTGDITVSPSGSPAWVVFLPNSCHDDNFAQDSFTFVAIDANGLLSSPATVTLTPTTSTSCTHQF